MTQPAFEALNTSAALNSFLHGAVKNGHLEIEHVRHAVRQPESEIFVRKVAAAFHSKASKAEVRVNVTEVAGAKLNLALAEIAHQSLLSRDQSASDSLTRFALMQSSTIRDWSLRFKDTPAFIHSPITVACGVSPMVQDEELLRALDSVFLQTLADVHATLRLAAESGAERAVEVAQVVMDRRTNSGDFSLYSLAPLSQDTRYGMELTMGRLGRRSENVKKQFGANEELADLAHMSSAQILDLAIVLATDGMSGWLERHGVDPARATKLCDTFSSLIRTLSAPQTGA